MRTSNVELKLVQTLEVVVKPISRSRLLKSRPVVLFKNSFLKIPNFVYMRLDGFEYLEDLPVPENYGLRTFGTGDEDTWIKIVRTSFERLFPVDIPEICQSNDFDPDGVFFLTYRNQAVGTVYAKQMHGKNLKTGYVIALCVLPEHQGKKLGRLLVLHALHYFKSKGLQSAVLDVDEFNRAAVKTYLSLGFKFAEK